MRNIFLTHLRGAITLTRSSTRCRYLSNFKAYAIQNVIAPDFDRPETLYLKDPDAAPGCRGELPWTLSAGHELSTDTYLNSLYHHVWTEYANIGRVGLQVAADAEISIEFFAVQRDQGPIAIAQWAGSGRQTIWLDDVPEGTVRFTFTLRAAAEVNVTQLRWVTDAAAHRAPSLSVGLCTFNREPFLARTVEALVQQHEKTPAIKAIYVINQGATFSNPALLENAKLGFVNVLEQPNLGGCGGFTRSMLESITSENPTTHHVLMDDDIVLDPRMLDRIALFLGYCEENLALGGQMLEIERPTRLYEAGGRLNPLWFVEPVGHNLEMDRPEGVGLFNETPLISYNAWWFCVIPTDVIRTIGLPPPLFIRGDDIEYGCRMSEAGIATVPLPGCVVWHENFTYKASDWLLYYDLRNRLILASLHPDIVTPPDSLYLLGYCMSILLQHRYRATEVSLKAISDAIGDPKLALGKDGATRHQTLMSWVNSLPEPKVYRANDLPQSEEGQFIPLDASVSAMVKMSVKGFITLHLSRITPRRKPLRFRHMPEATSVGARDYLAARNPDETEFTLYKSDLRQLWRLFFRTLRVCFQHMLRSKKMAKVYQSELEDMRSAENWRKAFGMRP